MTCATCSHWTGDRASVSLTDQALGECRRFPPVVTGEPPRATDNLRAMVHRTRFPVVRSDAHCGEHRP